MKLRSHRLIVKYIHGLVKEITGLELNLSIMELGSISPDISPLTRFQVHDINSGLREVFKTRINMMNYGVNRLSFKMGRLTHYIADSFCLAHNSFFMDVKKHYLYERKFIELQNKFELSAETQDYLLKNIENFSAEFLREENRIYMSNVPSNQDLSVLRDLDYAVKIGALVVLVLAGDYIEINTNYLIKKAKLIV